MRDDDPTVETNERVIIPWSQPGAMTESEVLHLVVALFHGEDLDGAAAALDQRRWLGRGSPQPDDHGERLAFEWQRPGVLYPVPSPKEANISRRQLTFTPAGPRQVRVDCVGQRDLYHNGVRVQACMAAAGDTLRLENVAVFVLEMRAPMPKVEHYPLVQRRFEFGHADTFGRWARASARGA